MFLLFVLFIRKKTTTPDKNINEYNINDKKKKKKKKIDWLSKGKNIFFKKQTVLQLLTTWREIERK